MLILNNSTPFAAERSLIADREGRDLWIVAVKATFWIHSDGTTEIADDQEAVLLSPKHVNDDPQSSLLYEADLDYAKPTTDVTLNGHAYAPEGQPVSHLDVTLKVGNVIHKTLRVIGDRVWKPSFFGGLKMTPPEPFIKMPLIYERAFGGTDKLSANPKRHSWEPQNPVGVGFATRAKHLIEKPVPNIEDPTNPIRYWKCRPSPVGFGPIARHWAPRVKLAGTYDKKWEQDRAPLLPHDFDEQFFQCAPKDQQTPKYLRGGEVVALHHLTPNGFLRFRLPRIAFGFSTLLAAERIEHRANLHSVILEPDIPRVLMVWHTVLPCHGKKLMLNNTRVFQKKYLW